MSLEAPIYSAVLSASPKVGMVVQAVSSPGTNWHECDGSLLSKATYPDLATALAGQFEIGLPSIATTSTLQESYTYTPGIPPNGIHHSQNGSVVLVECTKTSGVRTNAIQAFDVSSGVTSLVMGSIDGSSPPNFLVGTAPFLSYTSSPMMVSTDNKTWVSTSVNCGSNILPPVKVGTKYFIAFNGTTAMYETTDFSGFTSRTASFAVATATLASNGTNLMIIPIAAQASKMSVSSSPDAVTWTTRNVRATTGSVRSLCWNGTVFCCNSTAANETYTSPDAITWTPRITTGCVTSACDLRVVNGVIMNGITQSSLTTYSSSSTDGVTWTSRTMPGACFSSVSGDDGTFYLITSSRQLYSTTNGVAWTTLTLPTWLSGTYNLLYCKSGRLGIWSNSPGLGFEFEPSTGKTYFNSTTREGVVVLNLGSNFIIRYSTNLLLNVNLSTLEIVATYPLLTYGKFEHQATGGYASFMGTTVYLLPENFPTTATVSNVYSSTTIAAMASYGGVFSFATSTGASGKGGSEGTWRIVSDTPPDYNYWDGAAIVNVPNPKMNTTSQAMTHATYNPYSREFRVFNEVSYWSYTSSNGYDYVLSPFAGPISECLTTCFFHQGGAIKVGAARMSLALDRYSLGEMEITPTESTCSVTSMLQTKATGATILVPSAKAIVRFPVSTNSILVNKWDPEIGSTLLRLPTVLPDQGIRSFIKVL